MAMAPYARLREDWTSEREDAAQVPGTEGWSAQFLERQELLRVAFEFADAERDGYISWTELRELLLLLELPADNVVADVIFHSKVDAVTFEQFIELVGDQPLPSTVSASWLRTLAAGLMELDEDCDGGVSAEEMRRALRRMGVRGTDREFSELFAFIDRDGSLRVSPLELALAIRSQQGVGTEDEEDLPALINPARRDGCIDLSKLAIEPTWCEAGDAQDAAEEWQAFTDLELGERIGAVMMLRLDRYRLPVRPTVKTDRAVPRPPPVPRRQAASKARSLAPTEGSRHHSNSGKDQLPPWRRVTVDATMFLGRTREVRMRACAFAFVCGALAASLSNEAPAIAEAIHAQIGPANDTTATVPVSVSANASGSLAWLANASDISLVANDTDAAPFESNFTNDADEVEPPRAGGWVRSVLSPFLSAPSVAVVEVLIMVAAAVVEVLLIYWIAMATAMHMSKIVGLALTPLDRERAFVVAALARSALQLGHPTEEDRFGIYPLRKASKLRLCVAAVLWKAKASLATLVVKMLCKRALVRAGAEHLLAWVALPVMGLVDALVMHLALLDCLAISISPQLTANVVDTVVLKAGTERITPDVRLAIFRAVGAAVVALEAHHPTCSLILVHLVRLIGRPLATDVLDDVDLLVQDLPQLPGWAQQLVLRLLFVAIASDGTVGAADRACVVRCVHATPAVDDAASIRLLNAASDHIHDGHTLTVDHVVALFPLVSELEAAAGAPAALNPARGPLVSAVRSGMRWIRGTFKLVC